MIFFLRIFYPHHHLTHSHTHHMYRGQAGGKTRNLVAKSFSWEDDKEAYHWSTSYAAAEEVRSDDVDMDTDSRALLFFFRKRKPTSKPTALIPTPKVRPSFRYIARHSVFPV